jgi:hypothetical protein
MRVRLQSGTIVNPAYRADLERYAISRFVDCAADTPQTAVPPIPAAPGGAENVGALEGSEHVAPPPL